MSCHFEGDADGHLQHVIEVGDIEPVKATIDFKFLTSKNGKGKVGVENLGSIVIHTKMLNGKELENKPLSFTCIIGKKQYLVIPYKFKIESKRVAESYKLLDIPAHAITLKNFIDSRNGKIFLTRTLTYYTVALPDQQTDPIKMYIYGIPQDKFGYPLPHDSDVNIPQLETLTYEKIEEIKEFVADLSGRNYIRGRTLLTAIESMEFRKEKPFHKI